MSIEIKRSIKPIDYNKAIELLEKRIEKVINKTDKELIWFLEHNKIYTAGTSSVKSDILDKNVKIVKTSRGGKITCHSRGQLICYLVIDLTKRNKDIRKFIISLENSIIQSLSKFNISAKSDRKNIGIWIKNNNETKKISSIGIRVRKWIAYHGFSINIDNDLDKYNAIIPCGIKDKGITNLKKIKNQNYEGIENRLIENFISNLKN